MSKVDYTLENHVAVVTLNSDDNRFNPDFIHAYLSVLDEIENSTDATTMVVTSSHEKIFSNGIDLDWLMSIDREKDSQISKSFFYLLNRMLKRTLTYPLLTIAAMNGHVFAGGAIWACAFDFRFMRTKRGFFCLPEADLKIPFLPGMLALVKKGIPAPIVDEMVYTGIRLTAEQCIEHGIVKGAFPVEHLMEKTMDFAGKMNKDRRYVREMRHRMYKNEVYALEIEDVPFIESGIFGIE